MGKFPPASVLILQQAVSYVGVGPYLKYVGDLLYSRLSGRTVKVILSYPNGSEILRALALATALGFVVNGARGVRNIPKSWLACLPEPLQTYIHDAPPEDFEQWSRREQLVDTVLRGGLIGMGIYLKTHFRDRWESASPLFEFLGLETRGKVFTWLMETGVSLVYIPVMALAMGKRFHLNFFTSALIVSAFTNLSMALISSSAAPRKFAEANVIRQLFYFIQNSIALLAGKGSMTPGIAFGVQLGIVSAGYIALKSAKTWLQRFLGTKPAVS